MSRHIKILSVILVILSMTVVFADRSQKVSDTIKEIVIESIINDTREAQVIFENEHFIYSFKDERDVLYIYDKRNDYTWKSGLDIAAAKDVKAALRKDEPLGFEPLEQKMNETFTGIANSLITIEYYDDSLGIKRLASASKKASSELKKVVDEDNHFVLDITYEEQDINLQVHLLFSEEGYDIRVNSEDIKGEDRNQLAAVLLNPFLGASGGVHALYDATTGKHGDYVKKDPIPGYVFVPDGPGALIHFDDYNVSLIEYSSKVYGENYAKSKHYEHVAPYDYVPFKNPLMPVYGIAHTGDSAAFVGYASSGDEFMEIVVMPEENTTLYTWAYPRFVYNNDYYQVFNKSGEGYFTLFEEPNNFDINFHYEFLVDNETESADYFGMAKKYQNYLLENGTLSSEKLSNELPIRIDFIMSDVKNSVLGLENVVVTTADDIGNILTLMKEDAINNITSGLYGWQKGGVTTAKPWKTSWTNQIGSKSDFKKLISLGKELDYDVSFVQDYLKVNEEQVNIQGKVIKHMNNWYLKEYGDFDLPVSEFYYARPDLSVEWLEKQTDDLSKLDIKSHTIEGISSNLISEHGRLEMAEQEVIQLFQKTMEKLPYEINLKTPNQYLWKYTDRFLQAPVFATQYLIETQTVPFLQIVLNGKMELFGPYSNFSFANKGDILKMIDYNISPSFIISEKEAYLLSATNSQNLYSTEFLQYRDLVKTVYGQVSKALNAVRNQEWVNREEIQNKVFMNTYENGIQIVINYNKFSIEYKGKKIDAETFDIFY